jgi:hypothetical protein
VLGPVEAALELAAFLAVFITSGWRPGDAFPHGATLLAASGAAFGAVVLGQVANAFACRSTLWPPWRIGRTTNRLLLGAIVAELGMLGAFPCIPPVADLLDQAPPSLAGWAVALLAIPAVLAADALHKAAHRAARDRARPRRWDLWPYGPPRPEADHRSIPTAAPPDGRERASVTREQTEVR